MLGALANNVPVVPSSLPSVSESGRGGIGSHASGKGSPAEAVPSTQLALPAPLDDAAAESAKPVEAMEKETEMHPLSTMVVAAIEDKKPNAELAELVKAFEAENPNPVLKKLLEAIEAEKPAPSLAKSVEDVTVSEKPVALPAAKEDPQPVKSIPEEIKDEAGQTPKKDSLKRKSSKLSVEESNAKLQAALERRKAGSSKPAAMKKPVAKASTNQKVAKKPGAKTSEKKAVKNKKEKETERIPQGHGKPMPAKPTRLKYMPHGCSKCRKVPGCTPSCWRKKGWM